MEVIVFLCFLSDVVLSIGQMSVTMMIAKSLKEKSVRAAKIARSLEISTSSMAALRKDCTFLTLSMCVVTSFLACRQYSPYDAKAMSDEPYMMMSGTTDGGRDARTWSFVRSTSSAARGDDTTRVRTAPRRRSITSGPYFLARLRRETCGRAPTRCRCPMMGSAGGEGGRRCPVDPVFLVNQ